MNTRIKSFEPWHLGAPLYMPGNRRDILEIANGEKYPWLRAMIFCTEDAVLQADVDSCVRHLGLCLQGFKNTTQQYRFIRVRNPDVLGRLLALPDIDKIDGFVLPKFTEDVFNDYLDQLRDTTFKVMPTLETKEVFNVNAMTNLCQGLLQSDMAENVLMLRIGGNDLMNLLGLRRERASTIYETPLGHIIAQLVTIFKPYGFSLSAPVFEYLDDPHTLLREMKMDLAYGLIGKTAIHPTHVPMIEEAFKVNIEDYEMALSLSDLDAPAVFRMHDAMCEVATHQQWATQILSRQQCYGLKEYISMKDRVELSF